MYPFICSLNDISKSSDTFDSLQIFSLPSTGSINAASWRAFQRRKLGSRKGKSRVAIKGKAYELCPTKGATSPFAQAGGQGQQHKDRGRLKDSLMEMHRLIRLVK